MLASSLRAKRAAPACGLAPRPAPLRYDCSTVALWLCVATLMTVPFAMVSSADTEGLPPVAAYGGQDSCPCLTKERVRALTEGVPIRRPEGEGGEACLEPTPDVCVPEGFGSGSCRAWDEVYNPNCNDTGGSDDMLWYQGGDVAPGVPSWCSDGWCYVDPDNCTRPNAPSTLFPNSTLHYSYEACGYVDLYTAPALDGAQELRITYTADEFFRMYSRNVTLADGSTKVVRRGAVPQFFGSIAVYLKLNNLVEVPITDASKDYVMSKMNLSSAVTACAAMLAMNITDICVGDAWATKERMLMTNYAIAHSYDQFYLVLPDDGGTLSSTLSSLNYTDLLQRPFMPFTLEAWVGYAVTISFAVLVYTWLEVVPRWAATSANCPALAAPPEVGEDGSVKAESFVSRFVRWRTTYWLQLQISAAGLAVLGDRAFQPMTFGGKIVSITVQLFIVTMVASYTANLAAVLSSAKVYRIENLNDAIAAKVTICVPDIITDLGEVLGLGGMALPRPTSDILDAINRGECSGGILPEMRYEATRGLHGCRFRIAGMSVSVQKNHFMLQERLVHPFNRAVERLLSENDYVLIEDMWRSIWPSTSGIPACAEGALGAGVDSTAALSLYDMGGLYLLVTIGLLLGLLTELILRCLTRGGRLPDGPQPFFEVEAATVGSFAVTMQDKVHAMLPPGHSTAKLEQTRGLGNAIADALSGAAGKIKRRSLNGGLPSWMLGSTSRIAPGNLEEAESAPFSLEGELSDPPQKADLRAAAVPIDQHAPPSAGSKDGAAQQPRHATGRSALPPIVKTGSNRSQRSEA